MSKIEEIWKPVKGFEGLYEVSNLGRVFHLPTSRYKIPSITKNGYYYVALWKNNKHKHWLLHRLLAIAFIANPKNKSEVNHKDCNKLNNSLENLEWVTHQENAVHSYLNGMTPKPPGHKYKGTEIYNSILTKPDVLNIREQFTKQ